MLKGQKSHTQLVSSHFYLASHSTNIYRLPYAYRLPLAAEIMVVSKLAAIPEVAGDTRLGQGAN